MRRTSAGVLVLLALLGAGVGFLLDQVLTATGRATLRRHCCFPCCC